MTDAFKFMHGRVLGEFHLMGDGQVLYGEPYPYQYGLFTDMCWSWLIDYGYSPDTEDSFLRLPFFNQHYDRYDWLGCQFLSGMYIDFGLRQDVPGNQKEDHYTAVLFDELAARADWAFQSPEECNHAPVVTADTTEFTVKAGDTVTLSGSAIDPDGNELTAK